MPGKVVYFSFCLLREFLHIRIILILNLCRMDLVNPLNTFLVLITFEEIIDESVS